uniref:CCHC-type domain-containing protein n=1 Tax=Scleropages formosus TaxID=113540 RepID=A0A8C9T9F1_SCLFO
KDEDDCWRAGEAVSSRENNRAHLFYPQQPPFCRLCQGQEHTAEACKNMKCRNCLETGHFARDCKGPRCCSICTGEDHLARLCLEQGYLSRRGFGHTGAECTNMRCNNCLERGHMAKDCKGLRMCNICGAEDHLAHTCGIKATI